MSCPPPSAAAATAAAISPLPPPRLPPHLLPSLLKEREQGYALDECCLKPRSSFRLKSRLKSSGAVWDRSAREWYYPKSLFGSKQAAEQAFRIHVWADVEEARREAAERRRATLAEKRFYHQNTARVRELVEAIQKRCLEKDLRVLVPHDGYCCHCNRSWAKTLLSLPSPHNAVTQGLSACPCCCKSWDD